MTMKKGAALCVAAVMACAALAGCSKKDDSAQSGASSAATSESSTEILDNSKLTEMPDGVTLSEDQMKTTMSAYAAYMSEALTATPLRSATTMMVSISMVPRPPMTVLPLRFRTCPSSTT